MDQVQEWLLTITGSATLVTVAVSTWLSLREYRLKTKAEIRMRESSQAEADVRLVKVFLELMDIANGRSGYTSSEEAISWHLTRIQETNILNLHALNQELEDLSIITLPVGSASQDAAIAAIVTLAEKYEVLRVPAAEAIDSLKQPYTSAIAHRYSSKLKGILRNSTDRSLTETDSTDETESIRSSLLDAMINQFKEHPSQRDSFEKRGEISVPASAARMLSSQDIAMIASHAHFLTRDRDTE